MQIAEKITNRDYEVMKSTTVPMEEKQTIGNNLFSCYAYFIVYSFIGWVWETVITTIDTGTLEKRGFLDVPLLPIYGFAITFIAAVFSNKGYSLAKIFFGSALITSTQEYVTSWGLEKIFHQVWWDYSQMRFQIQGRVCLIGAITFGIASVLIVQFIHPRVEQMVKNYFDHEMSRRVCLISIVILILDTILKFIRLL